MLEAAWAHRSANTGLYGIVHPFLNPWTSDEPLISIVMGLFNATAIKLATSSADDIMHTNEDEMSGYLPRLAAAAFKCFRERLDWLER